MGPKAGSECDAEGIAVASQGERVLDRPGIFGDLGTELQWLFHDGFQHLRLQRLDLHLGVYVRVLFRLLCLLSFRPGPPLLPFGLPALGFGPVTVWYGRRPGHEQDGGVGRGFAHQEEVRLAFGHRLFPVGDFGHLGRAGPFRFLHSAFRGEWQMDNDGRGLFGLRPAVGLGLGPHPLGCRLPDVGIPDLHDRVRIGDLGQ